MTEISVIVPIYKVEKYLHKCVDSILAQTFTDFEVWLVDDGSPDKCGEICDEYAKKDSRVKVIHKKNGGLSDARNVALDVMTGKYVTFVDSDDWIPTNSLTNMYGAIQDTDAQIAIGNIVAVYEDGTKEVMYSPTNKKTLLSGKKLLTTINQPCAPNRLYKRYIFDELRYPVGKLYEDLFIYHRILDRVEKIVLIGKTNYYYYIRDDSIMRQKYSIKNADVIDAIYSKEKWLESKGEEDYAREQRLHIYARVAAAWAFLDRKDIVNKKRLTEVTNYFLEFYPMMMKDKNIGLKQKIRLFLLKNCPSVHTKIYGKKISIV